MRFGAFEFDLEDGELRRDGRRVRLAQRPLQVLAILASRSGKVVSREELRREVWNNAWIDLESSINTAIRELRRALGDTPAASRYIETVPRSGYRFVAPVETTTRPVAAVEVTAAAPEAATSSASRPRTLRRTLLGAGAVLLLVLVGAGLMVDRGRPDSRVRPLRARLVMSPVGTPGNLSQLAVALREETLAAALGQWGSNVAVLAGATDGPGAADVVLEVTLSEEPAGMVRTDAKVVWVRYDQLWWTGQWVASETATRELVPVFAEALALQLASVAGAKPVTWLPENELSRWTLVQAMKSLGNPGRESIAASRRAVAASPDSGHAHAVLAEAYLWAGLVGDVDPWVWAYRAALSAAEQAVRLDPGDAEAHAALGGALLFLDRDPARAAPELERAAALEPRLPSAQSWLAAARSANGEHAAATAAARAALATLPLVPYFHAQLSRALLLAGDAAEAETVARRALLLAPDSVQVRNALVRALLAQGRLDAAADALTLPPVDTDRAAPGSQEPGVERWRSYLASAAARHAAGDQVSPFWLAAIHASLGDDEQAWRWLDESLEAHSDALLFVASDPAFERLRASARWPSFVDAVFGPAKRRSRSSAPAAPGPPAPPARAAA
jgi:DNA-binding winged helix-turn-helix (wHTH) protein